MKVRDLVEQLRKYDAELPVIARACGARETFCTTDIEATDRELLTTEPGEAVVLVVSDPIWKSPPGSRRTR